MSKIIRIKFQNGIDKQTALRDILNELADEFVFEESDDPDFVLFGPYGNDIPPRGKYVRIGYFCENIIPDMSICDWAFGIPLESEINNHRYKRIQWHGVNPQSFIKKEDYDAEETLAKKTGFCNFLYSHKVPYREDFFKQLSKYKKVDAPGKSMNNMPAIDQKYTGDMWQRKRQFLSSYKFTIAFENYVYPGYQTEKLYDAMLAYSTPVYCGDPNIGQIFNTSSFVNASDYIHPGKTGLVNWLQKKSQQNFIDILPSYYTGPKYRVRRKLKALGRELKMNYQFQKLDFEPVIERIKELDQDDTKYLQMLNEPWFNNNKPPGNLLTKERWIEIFSSITK